MNGNQSASTSTPTIGVDIFKELINGMKNEINTNLVNDNAKLDSITTRIHYQELKINDLGQRVESLEKHLSYSDVAKLPPQPPPQPDTYTNTQITLTPTKTK